MRFNQMMIEGPGRGVLYKAPPIYARPDVLRDLLHRLNAKLVLHWLPKGTKH
jgi:hypothetical protein